MPNVSVIISTYNRAESLRDTIESLLRQEVNGYSYEIIVVDNNSADHTREVMESFKTAPPIRYAFEPEQGLSYARNRGIRESKGELIAFTDDDVVCDRNWVASLWECYKDTGASAIGGKIERLWKCERPEWLTDEISGPLIRQDLGIFRKRWDSKNQHMVGANMAFHRSVFETYGVFREELGRKGDLLVGGEDREFFLRLVKANVPIFYEPSAVVAHKVVLERISKEFMRKWFSDVGKTLGHEMEPKWHHVMTIAPLWLWKKLWISLFCFLRIKRSTEYDARRFTTEIWLQHYLAMMWERFVHWLPGGTKWCVFNKENRTHN